MSPSITSGSSHSSPWRAYRVNDARCVDNLIPASLQIDQNRSFSGRNGEVNIDGPVEHWITFGTSIAMMTSSCFKASSGSAKEMYGGVNNRRSVLYPHTSPR